MRSNKLILSLSIIAIAGSMVFTSCKKRQAFKNEDGEASTDSRNVISENDAAINDVNTEMGAPTSLRGRGTGVLSTEEYYRACGVTVKPYTIDTTNITNGSILITYDGVTVVNNRKRSGQIRLTILNFASGKRWKQAGCVLKVDFINYKVTRASDGKFVTLNGTQNYTNVSGGSWLEFLILKTQSNLSTSVSGTDLNVTFDDGKTAVYNINRKITFTLEGANQILTCTGEGIGSKDGMNNLENYGTTRDGDAFTSQVSTPIVWNWTCGWWAPTQGNVEIKVASKEFTLKCTFAVDNAGNPVSVAANTCAYGWKIEWTYKKKTNKKIIGYL